MDITCLRTLALNILKNGYPESIASDIEIPELESCLICNEEIFLHLLKKSFTVLTCGHVFHRLCLENLRETMPICPGKNCVAEIEIIEKSPLIQKLSHRSMSIDGSQEKLFAENDPSCLDTIAEEDSNDNQSQNMESDIPGTSTASTLPSKRVGDPTSTNKATGKKQKANKEDSLKLKKLINELLSIEKLPQIIEVAEEGVSGGDANNYLYFFNKIDFAESKNIITNQEVIGSYFDFGGILYKRYKDLKKDNGKEASKALVFEEVRNQIPKEVTDVALRKRMERVRKIYKLFTAIVNGNEKLAKDKIALIRSFSANSLSKLSQSDIDFVIVKVLKKGK
ncbi:10340_t:CDS:1 [Entrophospora sp. SA101]|nr:10340_t:CDS:1 [Entrophospora sp. SA101]